MNPVNILAKVGLDARGARVQSSVKAENRGVPGRLLSLDNGTKLWIAEDQSKSSLDIDGTMVPISAIQEYQRSQEAAALKNEARQIVRQHERSKTEFTGNWFQDHQAFFHEMSKGGDNALFETGYRLMQAWTNVRYLDDAKRFERAEQLLEDRNLVLYDANGLPAFAGELMVSLPMMFTSPLKVLGGSGGMHGQASARQLGLSEEQATTMAEMGMVGDMIELATLGYGGVAAAPAKTVWGKLGQQAANMATSGALGSFQAMAQAASESDQFTSRDLALLGLRNFALESVFELGGGAVSVLTPSRSNRPKTLLPSRQNLHGLSTFGLTDSELPTQVTKPLELTGALGADTVDTTITTPFGSTILPESEWSALSINEPIELIPGSQTNIVSFARPNAQRQQALASVGASAPLTNTVSSLDGGGMSAPITRFGPEPMGYSLQRGPISTARLGDLGPYEPPSNRSRLPQQELSSTSNPLSGSGDSSPLSGRQSSSTAEVNVYHVEKTPNGPTSKKPSESNANISSNTGDKNNPIQTAIQRANEYRSQHTEDSTPSDVAEIVHEELQKNNIPFEGFDNAFDIARLSGARRYNGLRHNGLLFLDPETGGVGIIDLSANQLINNGKVKPKVTEEGTDLITGNYEPPGLKEIYTKLAKDKSIVLKDNYEFALYLFGLSSDRTEAAFNRLKQEVDLTIWKNTLNDRKTILEFQNRTAESQDIYLGDDALLDALDDGEIISGTVFQRSDGLIIEADGNQFVFHPSRELVTNHFWDENYASSLRKAPWTIVGHDGQVKSKVEEPQAPWGNLDFDSQTPYDFDNVQGIPDQYFEVEFQKSLIDELTLQFQQDTQMIKIGNAIQFRGLDGSVDVEVNKAGLSISKPGGRNRFFITENGEVEFSPASEGGRIHIEDIELKAQLNNLASKIKERLNPLQTKTNTSADHPKQIVRTIKDKLGITEIEASAHDPADLFSHSRTAAKMSQEALKKKISLI